MTQNARHILQTLEALGDPAIADHSRRFFKTGAGQYGEGDHFLGIRVPVLRRVAKQYKGVPLDEALLLLQSPLHEARLLAVLLMVDLYRAGTPAQQRKVCRQYLAHTAWVNNWDIVDSSAPYILGPELLDKDTKVLLKLARSSSLWERRIAVLATFHFIRHYRYDTTLALIELLLDDGEDLMHKACGWMLREIGNRDIATARAFLDRHALQMPRTLLRYAIEKFPEKLRQHYRDSR